MKSVRWRQNVVRQGNKPEAERFSVEDMLSRQDEKMRQDDRLNTSLTQARAVLCGERRRLAG